MSSNAERWYGSYDFGGMEVPAVDTSCTIKFNLVKIAISLEIRVVIHVAVEGLTRG